MLFNWASWVHRFQRGYDAKSSQAAFAHILSGGIAATNPISSAVDPFNHLDFYSFSRFWVSMTSQMRQLVHHILSCPRSEEHTSELQSLTNLVCRLLLEKKNKQQLTIY